MNHCTSKAKNKTSQPKFMNTSHMELLFTPTSWIIFTVFLFAISSILITKSHLSKRQRLPPGPSSFPLLGNLFLLRTQPHEKLRTLAATYGPVLSLKLGSVLTVVISSSSLAKQALTLHAGVFSSHFIIDAVYSHGHDHLSVGWLPTSSPQWRSLRRLYGFMFSGPKLESFTKIRHPAVVNMVERVRECSFNDSVVDVGQLALTTFFDVMFNTLFSRDVSFGGHNPREIEQLMVTIIKEIGEPNLADCFLILHSMDLQGIRRRLTLLCSKLFDVFNDLIDLRLKMRNYESNECAGSEEEDGLDLILDAMEDQKDISRHIVLHMLLDIIGSGMDSSSKAVEWTMAELLNNPQTLQNAKQELNKAIGSGKIVKDSDIHNLPYIQAAVKESFRLHPPSPFLPPRRANNEIELQGYTIPKGSRLLLNLWAMGRDPSIWENPDSFTPERFLDESKRQILEVIPFSAGRRICPGMQLASRSVVTIVASLINCFEWKLENEGEVDMQGEFRITLKKLQPLRVVPICSI